jgi:microcystin-dependent protein
MPQGFAVPIPRHKFTDVDNEPLALGLFYGFAAGTDTPLTFYSNSDCSSAHSNPATLSASGEITLFIPAATFYKFNLKDASGVQQPGWPLDGIVAIPAPDPPAPTPSPVPVGGIIAYGGTAAPTGYLLCNGALISRATFADLFTAIGEAYGAGDGSTTFGLPDLRQRFPLGLAASGTGNTLGGTGGLIDHVHTGPSHTHATTVDWTHVHAIVVAAHTHTMQVLRDGWSFVTNTPSIAGRLDTGDGTNPYPQAATDRTFSTSSDGAISQNTAAASVTSGSFTSAAGGTGNTGTANAPFQTVNYLIRST